MRLLGLIRTLHRFVDVHVARQGASKPVNHMSLTMTILKGPGSQAFLEVFLLRFVADAVADMPCQMEAVMTTLIAPDM